MSSSSNGSEGGMERQAPEVQDAEEAAIKALKGLLIALQHPAVSSSPQVLCAAARSCKDWREAVQQCSVCNTAVVLNPTKALQQMRSFAQWLPKHAALVTSITATAAAARPGGEWTAQVGSHPDIVAAQRLLTQALRAAGEQADAATAATDAAAAGHCDSWGDCSSGYSSLSSSSSSNAAETRSTQQQHRWRLASFSSDLPGVPDLLPVLPSSSLTHLHLNLQAGEDAERAVAEVSQLARLSSLQQLRLEAWCATHKLPDTYLDGLAQLSQLTSLRFTGSWSCIEQQLQQLLARPLPLHHLEVHGVGAVSNGPNLPSLAHLTHVTELHLENSPWASATTPALPPQLQTLHLQRGRYTDLAPVLALQQLQHLTVSFVSNRGEQHRVLKLAKLPALQVLHLNYFEVEAAAAAARFWVSLRQLRALSVQSCRRFTPEIKDMKVIKAGAVAAAQLTSLRLAFETYGVQSWWHTVQLCGSLACLTGLRELGVQAVKLARGDALALTTLTGLTLLELSYLYDGVGDVAASGLARSLKHLQHLDLQRCGINLGSTTFLAAVGQLKQLTYINMCGNDGLTQQGLMQLTGLSRLQQLHVDTPASRIAWRTCPWKNMHVTDAWLDGFWAAVRHQ